MIEMLYSCPENLDKMEKRDCSLYCDSCKREVYDFTGKTLAEVQKIQDENPQIECGVFDGDYVIEASRTTVQNIFRIAFAAVFILGFNVTVLFAQSPEHNDNVVVKEQLAAEKSFVSGQVFNHHGKPIQADISYYLGDTKIETKTDELGVFEIEIPARFTGKKFYIDFHAEGMYMQSMTIENLSAKCYSYEIKLEKMKRRRNYRHRKYAGFYLYQPSLLKENKKKSSGKF